MPRPPRRFPTVRSMRGLPRACRARRDQVALPLAGQGRNGRRDPVAVQDEACGRSNWSDLFSRIILTRRPKSSRGDDGIGRVRSVGDERNSTSISCLTVWRFRARAAIPRSPVVVHARARRPVGRARGRHFLDPSVAFKFSASESPGQVDVHFKVANGCPVPRAVRVRGEERAGDARRSAIPGRPREVRPDVPEGRRDLP